MKNPNDSAALTMLGQIAAQRQQFPDAANHFQAAAVLDATPERLAMLVRSLQMGFDPVSALTRIEKMPEPVRNSLDIRSLEALLLGDLGNYERELEIYVELIASYGDNPSLWMSYGTALKVAGSTEQALAAVRRAIDIHPTYGAAYWALANFKTYRFSNEDVDAMGAALALRPDDFQAMHFHFAIGMAFEQREDFELAFAHFEAANRMWADRIPPEMMFVTAVVDSTIEMLTSALFQRRSGCGFPSNEPIFIVGLPRSGSTLIEQILASHPMIEGTSELKVMPQLLSRLEQEASASGRSISEQVRQMDANALHDIGAEYFERTRPYRRGGGSKFVDKLPENWLHIGLIRLALPNATIIDARRHPLACGLSNFRQNYATGMFFSYSLQAIGTLYRDYLRMMDHMDRVQPGAVHHIINERLIDDFEGEVRRLLEFVGVPFDPACLRFHRNRRAVRTPSAEQVRRPINSQGVDLWRHYEKWLNPLKQALGPALAEWDKLTSA